MARIQWLSVCVMAMLLTVVGRVQAVPVIAVSPVTAATPERAMWGVVSGQVVDPDGLPVAGARVTRLGPGGGEAVTDQFGEFRLELTHDTTGPISVVIEKRSGTEVLHAIEQVHLTRDGDHAELPGVILQSSCEPQWAPVGTGVSGSGPFASSVRAFTVFDDGSGPALYVGGGYFDTAGGVSASNIARWDGNSWSAVGTGMNDSVEALAVFDDGSGPALYAGGDFTIAGGVSANWIAKWDGSSWSPLGSGMSDAVFALTVFDDGSGPALYAGGRFTTAGGVEVNNIAKWDGSTWAPLGSGVSGRVNALEVFDDGSGSGPALFVGGTSFTTAGSVSVSRIAKWDGSSWSALGSGVGGPVRALSVFDDGSGSGPALYVSGTFSTAGGVSVSGIAKWDGSSWSSLGSGLSGAAESAIALTVFDDGTGLGPALYAGGLFESAGGVSANNVAKWDGSSWSPLGAGTFGTVNTLAVFDTDSGSGPALYAGGFFITAGGDPAGNIARWQGCPATSPPCPCDTDNDGVQTIDDYFVYLTDFFAQFGGPGSADLDGDNTVTIDDFFIFLNCLPAIAASEVCP